MNLIKMKTTLLILACLIFLAIVFVEPWSQCSTIEAFFNQQPINGCDTDCNCYFERNTSFHNYSKINITVSKNIFYIGNLVRLK